MRFIPTILAVIALLGAHAVYAASDLDIGEYAIVDTYEQAPSSTAVLRLVRDGESLVVQTRSKSGEWRLHPCREDCNLVESLKPVAQLLPSQGLSDSILASCLGNSTLVFCAYQPESAANGQRRRFAVIQVGPSKISVKLVKVHGS
jgi:hypothetical protein